ncbi:general substrate transporter [Macrophomina phaseolina]|uniref:General substrate transporter n=1 Tax=Macrophomina phaseolina TaxID=35725 RepID=A0ABQ8GKV7_9PEZI|nr:general substrate transporter [Macrophomina phaseolina]
MSTAPRLDAESQATRQRAYASKGAVLVSEGNSSTDSILQDVTPQEEKKILRKIDWRVTIVLGVLWCITLIDRSNLGNASIAGMTEDLKLDVGMRQSLVGLIDFPFWMVFQTTLPLAIKYLKPRLIISLTGVLFGLFTLGQGLVHSWHGLLGYRMALGTVQAWQYPTIAYFITIWYTRYEVQKRFSVAYFIAEMSSGFSGILAYGLMQMKGLAGMNGWRWINIIEGIFTVLASVIAHIILVGMPDGDGRHEWRFLSSRERRFVLARIDADRADAKLEEITMKNCARMLSDIKLWGFAAVLYLSAVTSTGFLYFLPLIIHGMGFSVGVSQLLNAPPFLIAGLWCCLTGWLSDRWRLRSPFLVLNALLCLGGVPLLGFTAPFGARYTGICLVCMGSKANTPAAMAYMSNNLRTHTKKLASVSVLIVGVCLGGVTGALVFRQQDAPTYHPGLYASMVASFLLCVLVGAMTAKFRRDNRRAERGQLVIEGHEAFRYTY